MENQKNKVIIFSEFAEMCKILKRELSKYNPIMIIGDVPNEQRHEELKKFNEDPECKICIMSSAGMYGLNVQAANVVIHFDMPWSLSKIDQREGRAWRYGQKQMVMVYNLLGKGTVDMYMQKKIFSKRNLSSTLLGDPKIGIAEIKEILTYNEEQ